MRMTCESGKTTWNTWMDLRQLGVAMDQVFEMIDRAILHEGARDILAGLKGT